MLTWWATAGLLQAAAGETVLTRLRQAVELPRMNLEFSFGFSDAQDWMSDPEVSDPEAELKRLQGRLKNELKDAEIHLEMARIAALLGDPAERQRYQKVAVEAWRKWATASPEDPTVQIGLAAALRVNRELEEAERIVRKITAGPDASADGWHELASVLIEMSFRKLAINADGSPGPLTGGGPLSTTTVEDCGRLLAEAATAVDRMIKVAPSDSRGWTRRARIQVGRKLLEFARRPSGSPEETARRMFEALFHESAVPDLEAAARLRPRDPRLILGIVFHRLGPALTDMTQSMSGNSGEEAFNRLTDSQQAAIRDSMARIEQLGSDPESAVAAAAAWEYLALLRAVVRGDPIGAGKAALRGLQLDPARTKAFDLALAMAVTRSPPDWKLAEEVVRERLKARPDARTRYALVKVLNESGRPALALEEVHRTIKEHPGVAILEIAHVAIHIKAGDYPGGQESANMDAIGRAIQALPNGEEKLALTRNIYVTGAVLAALDNHVAEARQMLGNFLEKVKDDAYANAIDALVKQLP